MTGEERTTGRGVTDFFRRVMGFLPAVKREALSARASTSGTTSGDDSAAERIIIRIGDRSPAPQAAQQAIRSLHATLNGEGRTESGSPLVFVLAHDPDIDRLTAAYETAPTDQSAARAALRRAYADADQVRLTRTESSLPTEISTGTAYRVGVTAEKSGARLAHGTGIGACLTDAPTETSAETDPLVPVGLCRLLMASEHPAVARVAASPIDDRRTQRDHHITRLREYPYTFTETLVDVFDLPGRREELTADEKARVKALEATAAESLYAVDITVAVAASADACPPRLATRLEGLVDAGTNKWVKPTVNHVSGTHACEIWSAITTPGVGLDHAPIRRAGNPYLADPDELAALMIVPGSRLDGDVARAIARTPGERTPLGRPPAEILDQYRAPGWALGRPVTQDGDVMTEPIRLPPALILLNIALFGQTGAGKSIAGLKGLLGAHAGTSGASILIDSKGDGLPQELAEAYAARGGDLSDVIYIPLAEAAPQLGLLDIRPHLEAGRPRQTVIDERVDAVVEVLRTIMGPERWDQAAVAPELLGDLIRAGYDPTHGTDALSLADILETVREIRETGDIPMVSDPALGDHLAATLTEGTRDELLQGVLNRLGVGLRDPRLRAIFNAPDAPDDRLDLTELISEDKLILIDTSGVGNQTAQAAETAVLIALRDALRRRYRQAREASRRDADDLGIVTVLLEEAARLGDATILKELLAESRSYRCGVITSTQSPSQVGDGVANEAIRELLNDAGTIMTGKVPTAGASGLADRFATAETDPEDIARRLAHLPRHRWLVSLPAQYSEQPPRVMEIDAGPLPRGLSESATPLSAEERVRVEDALADSATEVATQTGRSLAATGADTADDTETPTHHSSDHTATTLPYLSELPEPVTYHETARAIECETCGRRYPASDAGMVQAIDCHHDVDAVDVPVVETHLTLTPSERQQTDCSLAALRFLQVIFNAQVGRLAPPHFDIVTDSMTNLRDDAGVGVAASRSLIDQGYLTKDAEYPHLIYSVTPDGADLLNERQRAGKEYGDGAGDLSETSHHRFMTAVLARYLEETYVEDPDSPVVAVDRYVSRGDYRYDVLAVDADGQPRVVGEGERVVGSLTTDAPSDIDKMAVLPAEEALLVAPTRKAGHKILRALADPADGNPRIDDPGAKDRPLRERSCTADGLTMVYRVGYLHDMITE